MGQLIDLIGKQFGTLLVVSRSSQTQSGSVIWDCICKCGNCVSVNGASLRYSRTRSCGCLTGEFIGKLKVRPDAARNKVWGMYKQSARQRGLKFTLKPNQFDILIGKACHYCGTEPAYESVSAAGTRFQYNGIDRLDSRLGYLPENCVPCCRPCNLMKRAMPVQEFLQRVSAIYLHTKEAYAGR